MRWPGFCGPTRRSQSLLASPERTINWYPHRVPRSDGSTITVLYPTPGLIEFATAPESPGRGIFSENDRCFAVIGAALYEVFADGTKTSRGTVATDQYPATMVTNGDGGGELFITSGNTGYILNLSTNGLSSVVASVTMGGMIDGFFVALDIDTSTLRISDLLDGTTWDSTQIAQRSTAPDPWKALLVKYPRIWLLGEQTGDVWYNAGTSPFPFAPISSIQIPYGIAAPFTLKVVGTSVMWLTHNANGDGQVVAAEGYTPIVVSDEAVEYAIGQYSRIDDAVAFSYQDQGHEFYQLNFPTAGATWVYDRTMAQWHERASFDTTTGMFDIWGPQYHTHVFDKHLVLHEAAGTIYDMTINSSVGADGNLIRRLRRGPAIQSDQERMFIDRMQVYFEPGLGLVTGQGSDPEVMLRLSRDGGKTWGNTRTRTAGALGQYRTRIDYFRCGSGRSIVPEITVTDPIPWRLIDMYADVRRGTSPWGQAS